MDYREMTSTIKSLSHGKLGCAGQSGTEGRAAPRPIRGEVPLSRLGGGLLFSSRGIATAEEAERSRGS